MLLQDAVVLQLPPIVQTFVVSLPEVPSTLMASAITDWRLGVRTRVVRTSADVALLTSEIIMRRFSLVSGSAAYARLAAELLSRTIDESAG